MLTEFKIPEVGENIKSGTVVKINVKPGDKVKKDQALLELETDKASLEVPSPFDGVIKEVSIKEGQEVKIGQVAMRIEASPQSPVPGSQPKTSHESRAKSSGPVDQMKNELKGTTVAITPVAILESRAPSPERRATKDVPAAPSVRRFAREIGIDIAQVPGSGKGGRISTEDVKTYAKQLNTSGRTAVAGIAQPPLPDFGKWGNI